MLKQWFEWKWILIYKLEFGLTKMSHPMLPKNELDLLTSLQIVSFGFRSKSWNETLNKLPNEIIEKGKEIEKKKLCKIKNVLSVGYLVMWIIIKLSEQLNIHLSRFYKLQMGGSTWLSFTVIFHLSKSNSHNIIIISLQLLLNNALIQH